MFLAQTYTKQVKKSSIWMINMNKMTEICNNINKSLLGIIKQMYKSVKKTYHQLSRTNTSLNHKLLNQIWIIRLNNRHKVIKWTKFIPKIWCNQIIKIKTIVITYIMKLVKTMIIMKMMRFINKVFKNRKMKNKSRMI